MDEETKKYQSELAADLGFSLDELAELRTQLTKKYSGSQITSPSGAAILASVESFVSRFVAYPSEHARLAHVLWLAHTHLMEAWDSTPRIAFLSPEPSSGKSRALEVSELLVPRPVEAVNVTPAYLFRKVGDEEGRPTILYDEIDTVFGPKARDNEEIRGLLNAGHRKHSTAGRCVVRGKQVFTEEIPAYCAVALAGLGNLPDTISKRAIIIHMRRRAQSESIQPYRRREVYEEGCALHAQLADWAFQVEKNIVQIWPKMPDGVVDRDADIWESLLAIADAAGDSWPDRARLASIYLVNESQQTIASLGVQLLADMRRIFADRNYMARDTVLMALVEIDDAPWSDIRGKPINSRTLSRYLSQYGIKQESGREQGIKSKGYRKIDFLDAWDRYLPAEVTEKSAAENVLIV